ncbi:MAG: deoxyribodipyrimidine photo-lyase [Myxococcota bacterium]
MTRGVHWFRSDLRLRDNAAIDALAARCDEVAFAFVLDPRLLAAAPPDAPRVRFLLDGVERLERELARRGHALHVLRGEPVRELDRFLARARPEWLSFARATTPYGASRDARVRARAERAGVRVLAPKDAVVFGADELRTKSGGLYQVFGPYQRAWLARLAEEGLGAPCATRLPRPCAVRDARAGTLAAGLARAERRGGAAASAADERASIPVAGEAAARRRLEAFVERGLLRYATARDLPAVDGTSRLSPHLRFGAVSARDCIRAATDAAACDARLREGAARWVGELCWRDFYAAQLEEHPRIARGSFRADFDALEWDGDDALFARWRDGRTGFPIVDAGMRQLAATGWMHNRVRMIVASFLTKDLGIDWRRGERLFFERLVDGDPASNNGGWQWSASTGTDPQPYFRIFNPTSQGRRFDPDGDYVRRFVPELARLDAREIHAPDADARAACDYPAPCVDHAEARERALARYRRAIGRAPGAGATRAKPARRRAKARR